MQKKNMVELINELKELIEKIEDAGGEIQEAEETVLLDLKNGLQNKINAYYHFIKLNKQTVEEANSIIEKFKVKKEKAQKKIDWMESILLYVVRNFGEQKIEIDGSPVHKMTIQKSKYLLLDMNVDVPTKFIKETISTSVDKVALKKALEAGEVQETDAMKIAEREHLKIK